MKRLVDHLRRSLVCCTTTTSSSSSIPTTAVPTTNNRRSGACQEPSPASQDPVQEDSLIDAAAATTTAPGRPSSSSSRSTVVGTIFGQRRGHVSFCVQSDPTLPPPFLFELSVPTQLLAREMSSGLLRIALDCTDRRSHQWKAYCNGCHVGYAVKRKLTDHDREILKTVRSMSAGAGVLENDKEEEEELGEVLYLRASYERVVGSRDSVSYHLINPAGDRHHHQQQQLSVFLMRSTG